MSYNNHNRFSFPSSYDQVSHNKGGASTFSKNQMSPQLSLNDVEPDKRGKNKYGLKLTKTPELSDIFNNFPRVNDVFHDIPKNRKALNFRISCLQIGSFNKEARHNGDLIGRCYFKKQKLAWEILNGNLLNKIEFKLSNISAIKASIEAKKGYLHIKLDEPPLFFHEVNQQTRKHTKWQQCEDFTANRQASLIREHILIVAAKDLVKHYRQIITGNPDLYELSRQPFPYGSDMCFPGVQFSNELHINNQDTVLSPEVPFNNHHSDKEISDNNNNNNDVSNSPTQFTGDNQIESTSNQADTLAQQMDHTSIYSGVNAPMTNDNGGIQPLSNTQPPDKTSDMAASTLTYLPYIGYNWLLGFDQLTHYCLNQNNDDGDGMDIGPLWSTS